VGQGTRQLGIGLVLGLGMAFFLTKALGFIMFEVAPQDPPVLLMVVVTITAVGILASLVPARRATRAEPVAALRTE
jgi:ABC-type antimicrobial peptide transport system permease subunit